MHNKVIVITGASSGIGKATAIKVAKEGAKVVLAARREEKLDEVVQTIKRKGGDALLKQTDVTSYEQVQELANFTIEEYGSLDVWINNAGIMPLSFVNKLKVEEWDKMVDINIKGLLYGIAAALPIMEEKQNGHIINVSSIAGRRIRLGGAVYSGTKYAVRAINEGLRQELSSSNSNIRTTLISPGTVATELRNTITDEDVQQLLLKQKSALDSSNIADAIVYAIKQPKDVSVDEVIIRHVSQS